MSVQKLLLPSGHSLDFIVLGSTASDAFPFVNVHGMPSAHPVMKSLHLKCKEENFKLISFSRGGYGDSTREQGRKVVDITKSVKALLDHLGHDKFVVAGWSAGGPHALACAARMEGCVAALCVAGAAPYPAEGLDWLDGQGSSNVEGFHAAIQGENELRKFMEAMRESLLGSNVAGITESLKTILPEVDKKAINENKDVAESVVEGFHEALRVSIDGWVDDEMTLVGGWGFHVSEIKKPVFLYHGNLDMMVPYGHGQWLASHIPKQYLTQHLIEGQGHFSIWLGNMDQMLKDLSTICRT